MALVRMFHAGSDRYQHASDAAFDAVWQHEGWVVVPEEEAAPAVDPSDGDAPKRARAK